MSVGTVEELPPFLQHDLALGNLGSDKFLSIFSLFMNSFYSVFSVGVVTPSSARLQFPEIVHAAFLDLQFVVGSV